MRMPMLIRFDTHAMMPLFCRRIHAAFMLAAAAFRVIYILSLHITPLFRRAFLLPSCCARCRFSPPFAMLLMLPCFRYVADAILALLCYMMRALLPSFLRFR